MIEDREALLLRLRQCAKCPLDERVVSVLEDPATRQVGDAGVRVSVQNVLDIWQVREKINRGTDHPLIGAHELFATLQPREPKSGMRQLSLIGTTYVSLLFFDGLTDEFLGVLTIRRRTAEEERARSQELAHMGFPEAWQDEARVA